MADKFERQKSARWVDAKAPSYGDDWGMYNDDEIESEAHGLEPLPDIAETICTQQSVLSGVSSQTAQTTENSHDESSKVLPVVPVPLVLSIDKGMGAFDSQSPKTPATPEQEPIDQSESHVNESEKLSPDVRYTNGFDTTQSDQSSGSDMDSIQEEPQELHLAGTRNQEAVPETTETLNPAPEPLVLSIDRMNLYSNDDLSFDEESMPSSPLRVAKPTGVHSIEQTHDDYDEELRNSSDPINHSQTEAITQPRHRVQTEALDSLINDLLQLEKLSLASLDESGAEQLSLDLRAHQVTPAATDISVTLSDMESPTSLFKKHESFISDLKERRASIRKAPPIVDSTSNDLAKSVLSHEAATADTEQDTANELDPVESNGSISTGSPSFVASVPSLPIEEAEISRKDSTVSSMVFSMGSWKPNTNNYRDRFVSNNDNESNMNVSMYHEGESGYSKFTAGMRPISGYAESFANSSCISVPDTIEANLHSINEVQSDGDDPSLEIMSMGTAKEAHAGVRVLGPGATTPSILRENVYGSGKFQEKISSDNFSDGRPEASVETLGLDISADGDKRQIGTEKATAYPVFNWQKIMKTSQAIDRIQLLKKAREDEKAYDTGLLTWLNETLHTTDLSSNIQIGLLATQAYKNAPHNDIRRHISLRSKVSMVKDKMDSGASFGRRFLSKGKKLMKSGSDS